MRRSYVPTSLFLIPVQLVISHLRISLCTAIDALIVAIETQHVYLYSKKTWTRRIVILTDGESPIELDEWENTAQAVNDRNIILTVMYDPIVSPHLSPGAYLAPAGSTSTRIRTNFSIRSRTNPISRYPFHHDLHRPVVPSDPNCRGKMKSSTTCSPQS